MPLSPGTTLIRDMSPDEIRNAYVLYIGAGAVAAAGLISLVRSMPMIWKSLASGLAGVRQSSTADASLRTDRDIPMKWVLIGCLAIIAIILFYFTLGAIIFPFGAILNQIADLFVFFIVYKIVRREAALYREAVEAAEQQEPAK